MSLTKGKIAKLIVKSKGICHLCGSPFVNEQPTVDHLIPRGIGGKDSISNLAVAHRSCNMKRNREDIQFFKMRMHMMKAFPYLEEKVFYVRDHKLCLRGTRIRNW